MSSNNPIELGVLVILVAIAAGLFVYASYWAFTVRKALVGHIYRRQALWAAIAGLFFAAFFVFAAPAIIAGSKVQNSPVVQYFGFAFILAGFIIIFAWIDATIKVARRSDPLHRNTIRWTGLRYFILIGTAFSLFFLIASFSNQQSPPVPIVQGFPLLDPFGGALFFGGLALILSARRSKDAILRGHLKWFAVFIVFLYITNKTEQEVFSHPSLLGNSTLLSIITYSLYLVSAYFLYMSARSLTPINRYPIDLGEKIGEQQVNVSPPP